jgi:hypothetical protein
MNYERPEVLVTYSEQELAEEAAICVLYGGPSTDPTPDPGGGN